jgi:hypothetical protein
MHAASKEFEMREPTTPPAAIQASGRAERSGASAQDQRGELGQADQISAGSSNQPRTPGMPPGGSLRRAAIVAGLGLLVMFLLAFASFSAFQRLIEEGDPAITARNIADHELLVRLITGSFVIVAGLDVLVAWALYVLLRPVNPTIAVLSAWLRVAYAAVFAGALSNLLVAVRLMTDGDALNAFGTRQLNAQVVLSVNQFKDGWNLALVIFGLHLLVLGYLVFTSNYIPRVLGILVAIASLGYLIDSFGGLLSDSYDANVASFTFPGEVLLMGWLLWRGRRLQGPAIPTRPSAIASSVRHHEHG